MSESAWKASSDINRLYIYMFLIELQYLGDVLSRLNGCEQWEFKQVTDGTDGWVFTDSSDFF